MADPDVVEGFGPLCSVHSNSRIRTPRYLGGLAVLQVRALKNPFFALSAVRERLPLAAYTNFELAGSCSVCEVARRLFFRIFTARLAVVAPRLGFATSLFSRHPAAVIAKKVLFATSAVTNAEVTKRLIFGNFRAATTEVVRRPVFATSAAIVAEVVKRLAFTTSAAITAEVVKGLVFTTSAAAVAEVVKRPVFATSATAAAQVAKRPVFTTSAAAADFERLGMQK